MSSYWGLYLKSSTVSWAGREKHTKCGTWRRHQGWGKAPVGVLDARWLCLPLLDTEPAPPRARSITDTSFQLCRERCQCHHPTWPSFRRAKQPSIPADGCTCEARLLNFHLRKQRGARSVPSRGLEHQGPLCLTCHHHRAFNQDWDMKLTDRHEHYSWALLLHVSCLKCARQTQHRRLREAAEGPGEGKWLQTRAFSPQNHRSPKEELKTD